jgi:hypothetical protein
VPAEVFFIERHVFLECIGEGDADEFVKSRPIIPIDYELRKKFYT